MLRNARITAAERVLPGGGIPRFVANRELHRQALWIITGPPEFFSNEMGRGFSREHRHGVDRLPVRLGRRAILQTQRCQVERVVEGSKSADHLTVRAKPHPSGKPGARRVKDHPHVRPSTPSLPARRVNGSQSKPILTVGRGPIGKLTNRGHNVFYIVPGGPQVA
jgi:hypothetical protein